jgi:hypothetical protein
MLRMTIILKNIYIYILFGYMYVIYGTEFDHAGFNDPT